MKKRYFVLFVVAFILLFCIYMEENPYIEIDHYKNLIIKNSGTGIITDADVQAYINDDVKNSIAYEAGDTIKKDAIVKADYTLSINGEVIETMYERTFEIGSDVLFSGETLEQELSGHNINESIEIERVLPKDYTIADYAGEKAILCFDIISIQYPVYYHANEQWLHLFHKEYDSMEEYQAEVRKNLQAEADDALKKEQRARIENALLDQIYVKKYPNTLIEKEYQYLIAKHKKAAEAYHMDFQEYLEECLHTEEKTFEKNCRRAAKENAILTTVCQMIAEREHLQIQSADYEKLFEEYHVDKVEDLPFSKEEVKEILLRRIVDDYLLRFALLET